MEEIIMAKKSILVVVLGGALIAVGSVVFLGANILSGVTNMLPDFLENWLIDFGVIDATQQTIQMVYGAVMAIGGYFLVK
jgi:hypothetical protein